MRFLQSGALFLALCSTTSAAPISQSALVDLIGASCPQATNLRISEDLEVSFTFTPPADVDAIMACIMSAYVTLRDEGLPISNGEDVEATRVKEEAGKIILY